MFSSRKRASPRKSESTPGGIVFDASSLLTHDVSKERKFRTKVHRKTLDHNPLDPPNPPNLNPSPSPNPDPNPSPHPHHRSTARRSTITH